VKLAKTNVLLFDFGGVVARFLPDRRADYLSEHTGLTASQINRRLFESGIDENAERGLYGENEILDVVRAALDNRVTETELIAGWARAFEVNEPLLAWIETLEQRVALFSNNGPMLVHCCRIAPLKRINAVFNQQVWSWELRATKPNQEAFERACRWLDVAPENCVLFDDDPACVEQARRSGWRAKLFDGKLLGLDEGLEEGLDEGLAPAQSESATT
jgi:glucose-1-phosphatase